MYVFIFLLVNDKRQASVFGPLQICMTEINVLIN